MIGIELHDVGISSLRWLLGVLSGTAFGFLLGSLSLHAPTDRRISWLFHFLRSVPIIGLVPVIQWVFGISEIGKIGLIAWAVSFPVWISVKRAAEVRLPETELSLRARRVTGYDLFRVYTFPRVLRGLFQGFEIALGIGWLAVVASELIATYSKGFWSGGLGHRLFYAFSLNDWTTGTSALLLFGMLGIVSSFLWNRFGTALFIRLTGIRPGSV